MPEEQEGQKFTPSSEALFVGIDLGTSRSAISAINGVRRMVESLVGYPKDAVARRMLKKDVVFGREVLENRLSLNVVRPLEKGVLKYVTDDDAEGEPSEEETQSKQAARQLLNHVVNLVEPGRDETIYGVVGVPAQATIQNKKAMIEAAKEVLDAVMLVSEPFAVAYGLDMLDDTLVIDIGAGTTDLCRMHGTVPGEEDQVSLAKAGDYVDQLLFDLVKEKYPDAQITVNMMREVKEQYGFVLEATESIQVEFPVGGRPVLHDVTAEVRKACESILPDVIEGVKSLVATFHPEFQAKLRNNIVLSGGGSQIAGLGKRIQEAMAELGGGRVTCVEEPLYAGANGALQLALDMPDEYWQQLA